MIRWRARWLVALALALPAGWVGQAAALKAQTAPAAVQVPHPEGGGRPAVAHLPMNPGEIAAVWPAARLSAPQRKQAQLKLVALVGPAAGYTTAQLDALARQLLLQTAPLAIAAVPQEVDGLVIDAANHWLFAGRMRDRLANSSAEYQLFRAPIMSTAIEVLLPKGPDAQRQADGVFGIFRQLEQQLNEWKPGSPIAEVNRLAGSAAVQVDADAIALLNQALEVSRRTGGAFDPTWAALWGVWDFSDHSQGLVPDPAEIARRIPLIDYRKVVVNPQASTVALPVAGMKLGLGGIAKGWALARAGRWLKEQGAPSFSLSAGGQVLVGGRHGARPWRVGLRHPRGAPQAVLAVLDLSDASISTSGDYEHYFERNGVRYHHIIDPHTGQPTRGLQSASVVAADATLADALSTALMVLGRQRALALVAAWPGVECALVDDAGRLWLSKGLQGKVTPVPSASAVKPGKVHREAGAPLGL